MLARTDLSDLYRTLFHWTHRTDDGVQVAIKTLKKDFPTPGDVARYRQEYEITSRLRMNWVSRVLALDKWNNRPVLVYEEFGGEDLNQLLRVCGISLTKAFGIDENWPYQDYTRDILNGQTLVLTADGIFVAHNSQGERFGKERFKDIVRENAGRRAKNIRMAILDQVAAFRGTKPQENDITLVVLKLGQATTFFRACCPVSASSFVLFQ